MHLAYILIILGFLSMVPYTVSTDWLKFYSCVGSDFATCAGSALNARYNQMKKANCLQCDKYFHCEGNYDAVYRCGTDRARNQRIAKKISDCREEAQDAGSADSQADQKANQFGRNGGNCQTEYLCKVRCKYNPRDKTCRATNCP